jgi:hypothetical protein
VEVDLAGYAFGLEAIHPDCRVLGKYLQGPAAGAAWCVERRVGKGRIVVLAAHAPNHLTQVLDMVLKDSKLQKYPSTWGTSIIPRQGNGKKAWLIANWD